MRDAGVHPDDEITLRENRRDVANRVSRARRAQALSVKSVDQLRRATRLRRRSGDEEAFKVRCETPRELDPAFLRPLAKLPAIAPCPGMKDREWAARRFGDVGEAVARDGGGRGGGRADGA